MSADSITYCLERLSDYRDFERLCSALLANAGYPDLDPLGGTGDEGRDAIIRSDQIGRKISFAYTVRSDWRVKLASDCKRVFEKGHGPDIFVFVCTEALSATAKDFAHNCVRDKYGWKLDLFDIERLRAELVVPQRMDEGLDVPRPAFRLRFESKLDRRAHLVGNRLSHVAHAGLVDLEQALKRRQPILAAGHAPAFKGATRGVHCLVDVSSRGHGDHCKGLLVGRVDDLQFLGHDRSDPFSIDEEICLAQHDFAPCRGCQAYGRAAF